MNIPKRIRAKLSPVTRRPKRLIGFGLIFLAAVVLGVTTLRLTHKPEPAVASSTAPTQAVGPQKGTPAYPTILPAGRSADSLGGWTRVSPPSSNPAYAYVDRLGPTQIIVSEQPLPDDFKADPENQTQLLAINYHATKKLPVGSTTVYVGTSVNGPQSVIFQTKGLLVLIKADSGIDDAVWQAYVNSLQ